MPKLKGLVSIVFLHVQKSGGSTVHSLLQSHLPEERFAKRDQAGHIVKETDRESADLIVSGHVTAADVRRLGGDPKIYTVLREPEERLLSHFYFLKSHTVENLKRFESDLLMRIKEMSLAEFLGDEEVGDWFRDFYVKLLDPGFDRGKGLIPDLDRARAFLGSCDLVGTTNNLAGFIREVFSDLDLPSPEKIPRINSREGLKERPGYETVPIVAPSPKEQALLRDFTSQDRVLYELAAKLAPSGDGMMEDSPKIES